MKNKGSLRQRANLLPSTPPTFSLCPFWTGVLHATESLFSKFSDWPNLPGRAKCGRGEKEKEWVSAPAIWQCSHSCALSGENSKCEEINECASKGQWIGAESLLSSQFDLVASGGFCATTYWSLGQLQALIFKMRNLLWVGKEGKSKVERKWFSVLAKGKNVPASLLATQSFSRGFCMRIRGSSWRVELRHDVDVFAQAPFEQEDGQADSEKIARASVCDVSGATRPSSTVTRAIRNVHGQPGSLRRRPAVVNLLRPDEIKTFPSFIPKPRILDIWDVIPAASSSPETPGHFWPPAWPRSCTNFDFEFSPSISTNKSATNRRIWFWSTVFQESNTPAKLGKLERFLELEPPAVPKYLTIESQFPNWDMLKKDSHLLHLHPSCWMGGQAHCVMVLYFY